MKNIQKNFKIYIIICGISFAVIIPGTFYIYKMISDELPDMNILKSQVSQEASEFAKDHSEKECIDKTMLKIKPCEIQDYKCRITGKLFLKQCLSDAMQSNTFCDGFPRGDEEAKTGKWRVTICLNHKEIHNIVCTNTFEAAEEHCAGKTGKR